MRSVVLAVTLILGLAMPACTDLENRADAAIKGNDYATFFRERRLEIEQNETARLALGDLLSGLRAAERGDYATGIKEWLPYAESGDSFAQILVGLAHIIPGSHQDYTEAARWFGRAAEQDLAGTQYFEGMAEIQYFVGLLYAYKWYRKAAEQDPYEDFGTMYDLGEGVAQDHAEAAMWIRRAAEQGDAKAQFGLGLIYAFDFGYMVAHALETPQDYYHSVMLIYGTVDDLGLPRDYAEAMKWLHKAAEQGHAQAQNHIALMYYAGGEGVSQDYTAAAKWYRKAAEQGLTEAQFWLGSMYYSGQGVPQDYAEAATWYRKGAPCSPIAQYDLGLMYRDGKGVPQDYVEALMWLTVSILPAAEKERDALAEEMSANQVSKAQRLAREWLGKHPEAGKSMFHCGL